MPMPQPKSFHDKIARCNEIQALNEKDRLKKFKDVQCMLATNDLVDEVFYEREIKRLFQKAEDEKEIRE